MREIWKYKINCDATTMRTSLSMPQNAEILCVQMQGNDVYIWAKIDPNAKTEARTFFVIATGQQFHSVDEQYIGTFQQTYGFVGHLFEQK